jgi:hypothetical protein
VSPNAPWSGSLESYHLYLPPKKVSKIPKIERIHNSLPRNAKCHFGCLGTLGVKKYIGVKISLAYTWYTKNTKSESPKVV